MAQRIITRNNELEKNSILREAIQLFAANKGLRLVWVCDICGMIHPDAAPIICESCGATHSLSLLEDARPEIHSRA